MTIRCIRCGHFIPYSDMRDGKASFHYEPDSHFGREVTDWLCIDCTGKEASDARRDGAEAVSGRSEP